MTFKKSRVRESRMLGSVRAKAEWLSYSTNPQQEPGRRAGGRARGQRQPEAVEGSGEVADPYGMERSRASSKHHLLIQQPARLAPTPRSG